MRKAKIIRKTKETSVTVDINLDGAKPTGISTTIPFFDHMLTLMAYHGGIGLSVKAKGDTEIDDHHLIEDTGIALGKALAKALGSKKGINRYGNFLLPMDEALSYVVIDISGRPYLGYKVKFKSQPAGFDFDLLEDFFYALAINAGITAHIELKKGRNNHHMAEAIFKGFGKALAQAVSAAKNRKSVPSTKGRL
jgi:imidazoleglycerol phosphate dehydratase HisB